MNVDSTLEPTLLATAPAWLRPQAGQRIAQLSYQPIDRTTRLPKWERALLEAADYACVVIDANPDSDPALRPRDFHRATLDWALRRATLVAISSVGAPARGSEFFRTFQAFLRRDEFHVLVHVSENRSPVWPAYIDRQRDRSCHVIHARERRGASPHVSREWGTA